MDSTATTDPAGPVLWRAEHAGEAFNQDIAACRALAAQPGGLHYLAHSTYGLRDFAMGMPDLWPGGTAMAEGLENAAAQLSLAVAQLDGACGPLDSGPLIRIVLQGNGGALFQVVKVPGQSFFGVTFDNGVDGVDHADRQLAALARESVQRLGGTSLNWGGFRQREDSGELWAPYQLTAEVPGSAPPYVVSDVGNAVPGVVPDLCLAALSPEDLHSVGIYQRDRLVWCADIFDAPVLAPLFQRVTPSLRRRGYARVAHQVRLQSCRFGRLLELTNSTQLIRLVLDVARGAMYALPLGDDEYLVAVTLIQSRVDQTDQKMRALYAEIRSSWSTAGSGRLTMPGVRGL